LTGDCLFCQIASGDIPAEIVGRNDDAVAFRDLNPQAPTHVLIIPIEHVDSVADPGSAGSVGALIELAASVAAAENLDGGWRLVTNVGSDAGQTVHHLHFHLLGGRQMGWPPG